MLETAKIAELRDHLSGELTKREHALLLQNAPVLKTLGPAELEAGAATTGRHKKLVDDR